MNENTTRIIALADGKRPSREIAAAVGVSNRYVRKVIVRLGLPSFPTGSRPGAQNHQFVSGRRVDLDGYVTITAPDDHPHAKGRPRRRAKVILEHRLVIERKLGRYLLPEEVADHIDGLTLHNAPSNLRVFASNSDHLHETLRGFVPQWTARGRANLVGRGGLRTKGRKPFDIWSQRRARGEIRLHQILLAALSLGIDSPFLSGTHRHTEKAGIDMSSRPTIERALADLYSKWGEDQTQL